MTRAEIRAQVRRDRRLRRGREVPRHAGEALFQRHVRAAGVRRGRAPGAGDPDRGRSAGGGRCAVSEEVPGQDAETSAGGRTVLFVSHNMGADRGPVHIGDVDGSWRGPHAGRRQVRRSWLCQNAAQGPASRKNWKRKGTGEASIVSADCWMQRRRCDAFLMGETLVLEMDVEFHDSMPSVNFTVEVDRKEMGMSVLQMQEEDAGFASSGSCRECGGSGWRSPTACSIPRRMKLHLHLGAGADDGLCGRYGRVFDDPEQCHSADDCADDPSRGDLLCTVRVDGCPSRLTVVPGCRLDIARPDGSCPLGTA